ncbi:IgGFc-binding protein [Perca flavescens]|uniref:IgGFc-binding protein n=1 Tax=Perca flavescens TaxID=8167 RepID=UPI00106E0DE1|nr:IgGFc-binding protein-like [Perca flavescens]
MFNKSRRIDLQVDSVSFSSRQTLSAGDGAVVSPTEELGTDYFVYTPTGGVSNMDSLLAIVNGNSQNQITILPGGDVALRGTRIRSQQPVAVLAGHQCLSLGYACEHVYEQLPHVASLGKEYMVPWTGSSKATNWAVIVAAEDNTELATDWAVETVSGFDNDVAILSERQGAGSVKVCVKGLCQTPKWSDFLSNNGWVWTNVPVGKQQSHVTVKGDARMAVYAYGGTISNAYGIAGVCSGGGAPPPTPAPDPCEKVKCRVKERCVKGMCVHVSTATCRAVGDPHYMTFDGRLFDFQVNGELQYMPVTLLGGKVSVEQSGIYASLTTDFGLSVKYDWDMRLYITVPSSYYEQLGGLCGNYNGDLSDDLPEPTGSSLSAVLKMIQAWKVDDKSDLFCSDNCAGRCPQCSPEQQTHYRQPSLCGSLSESNGPFSACHKQIDPSMYLNNCVYDVCINKGARQTLCDNLKSYQDACLSEGVKVNPQWRMVTKCPLSCPAGSHYEACGSACPASCVAPDSEKLCKGPCVEGCSCNPGMVLSGDRCVPQSSCGCRYQGRYYPADTTFWGDNTCTTRCKCLNGQAKCTSVTCKKNELCALKGGVRDCYPTSYATCQGSGDPHYQSFDKWRFDFQGTCTYVLSELTKGSNQDLEPFQVLVQNENRGSNKAVAYTKSVSLTVFGNITVSMSRASVGKILVNSQSVNLPYSTEDGKLSLFRRGFFGIVTTSFGLTLSFNWNGYVSLTLPSSFSSATAGLCGNYNGKPGDDLMKPDGTQAKNINDFGHSWKAGGQAGCTSDCPDGKCPECEPALLLRYQQQRYCGIVADKLGPFRQCHSKLDHTPFLTDCVFDLCMYQGHASALCNSLSAFSTSCQQARATVESWRTEQFCPPSCVANSRYDQCAPPCQPTCSGLARPEGCDESAPCTEGCVCDDGFMLSDDKCVPLAECGCRYEGQYYQTGQVFYPGQSCNNRCVCSEGGVVQCDPKFRCSANEKCVVKGGSASCSPSGKASCSVSGVRTVRSFDGQAYPLWGNCLFLLAAVEGKAGGMAAFSVYVQQKTNKDGSVSRSVELQIYNIEITMETGVVWEVKVNQVRVSLPVSLADGKVRVNQNGIHIIIETDFDLKMTYDSVAGVLLQVPSTYHSSPRGLCGNYNGDLSDDPTSAAVWLVKKENVVCEASCGATSCPEPDQQKVPEAKKDCDIIKAQQGPLAGCHSTVPPTPDYEACVREMSTGKGSVDILCRHIQNYVTACQLAGTTISKWRNDTFCPARCPAGSHYELCSSACSSTCSSLQRSDPCPLCQEGCQCDGSLMADGGRCVPVEQCGCVVGGKYYRSATSVMRGDCTERCVCQSGQFSCNSTRCQKGEECRNRNGTVGCYSTDPCAEVHCRVKEHCNVSQGQGVCVPDSKATCWATGDPHYRTFDGWDYSFQGTCTYVLVNTTGLDPSLPKVTVTSKNELRGNDVGSFVRSLTVEILGHRIFIPTDRGVVLVDGIKTKLPVLLEAGSISITQAGIKCIIQSDFGVMVTFDWSTQIMVSISSSYYGNVGGLCGNYNGIKEDELAAAGGSTAVNVTQWAGLWSIEDYDPFCYHYCDGKCPQCSDKDRIRYTGPQYCGIMSDTNGPFSGCHGRVPVQKPVSYCLYDVCTNEGRKEVLCEALSNYLAKCQDAGASVLPWRQLVNCSVVCPAHSQYNLCGSACPPSCGRQPEVCPKVCVEGCFCDPGYVLSGKECVIKEKGCGCNHNGRYYLPGDVFWADSLCNEKCACDAATQKVQCKRTACRTGEKCSVVDGVQGCYPVSFKSCTAHGDPHFQSFDGRKFDFQGNCVYKLASVCGDTTGLTHFQVNLENNNRGNKRVSYAKVVTVKVYGNTYTLSVDYPGRVLVNGLENSLPFSNSSNQTLVQVYRQHRLAVIETTFLKVSFDFASAVRVEVATSYHSVACGLCGNMNNDPADDLMLPNGKLASNANEFGVSQWLADVEGCSHECKDCAPPLPPDFKPPSYTSVCDIITAKDGPLANCVGRVDSQQYRDDCIYDMVLNEGKQDAACDIISAYVEECQRKGGCVKSWRTRRLCWMQCAANSLYSVTAPGCPISCTSPSPPAECVIPPSEGCVCNPGYLLSQAGCVPLAECGCQLDGRYIVSGQTFYADSGCQRLCVCNGGMVSCENKPCQSKQRCGVQNGVRGCYANL